MVSRPSAPQATRLLIHGMQALASEGGERPALQRGAPASDGGECSDEEPDGNLPQMSSDSDDIVAAALDAGMSCDAEAVTELLRWR